jgi:hemolysin activation/secretion protein
VSGQVSVDDYGHADVGRWRMNGHVEVDSPTGRGDKLSADVSHAQGNLTNFGGLNYSLPLGPDGGRLSASYNQSQYRVGKGSFAALDVGGRSQNAGVSYLFAQERGRLENLYWGFGVQHARGRSQDTAGPSSDTDSNTLQLTSYFNRFSEDGSYFTLSGSLNSNGRKNDGTSNSAERARLDLDGSWYRPLGGDWSFSGRASSQWSPEPLTDLDKFYLGGSETDRAFQSGEVHGDKAVYLSGEVQYKLVPAWPLSAGWFVDSGKVWNMAAVAESAGSIKPVLANHDTLTSSGFELVFTSPGKTWNARLQWAHAIGGHKPLDGDEGGHTWFTIGMSF